MVAQALFHLGMPKTGTSLLQNVLHLATARGPIRDVHYPKFGRSGTIAHHALPVALRGGEGGRSPSELAGDLLADLEASPVPRQRRRISFYSSEGFANHCGLRPAPQLVEFLECVGQAMPVRAVLVLREMTSFLESMYLQSARYGHVTQDFDAYLAPRERWWADLLAGLTLMRDRMGEAFEIRLAEPGYDVLTDFAERLSLPIDRLLHFASRVAATNKLSWKAQIVLANLEKVEDLVGFPIDRLALVKAFQRGLAFRDDLASYTLYPVGTREDLAARLSQAAVDAGLTAYAQVFGPVRANGNQPRPVVIDFAALLPRDVVRLSRANRRIQAPAGTET